MDDHDYSQCQHNCGVGLEHCRTMRQLRASRLCGQIVLHYSNGTVVQSAVTITRRSAKAPALTEDDLRLVLEANDAKAEIRRLLEDRKKEGAA